MGQIPSPDLAKQTNKQKARVNTQTRAHAHIHTQTRAASVKHGWAHTHQHVTCAGCTSSLKNKQAYFSIETSMKQLGKTQRVNCLKCQLVDDMFCFNVNCPSLYSHLCVYILYMCVCFKTPCKMFFLWDNKVNLILSYLIWPVERTFITKLLSFSG